MFTIHQDVEQRFEWTRKIHFKEIPHEFHQTVDAAHGRIKIRRHWLLDRVEHLIDAHLWTGFQRVGLVESERCLARQAPTIEQRYYLLSLNGEVQRFAHAIRSVEIASLPWSILQFSGDTGDTPEWKHLVEFLSA